MSGPGVLAVMDGTREVLAAINSKHTRVVLEYHDAARATVERFVESVEEVANYEGDPRFPGAVLANSKKLLQIAIAAFRGEQA